MNPEEPILWPSAEAMRSMLSSYKVTIVTQEATASPDLEISVGDWPADVEIEKYHRTKPINAIATSPLSRAIDATRTQFEAPSLRYVNKSHEINNDSDE